MARDLQPCGTMAAYNRHYRHREEACEACRQANKDYLVTYRTSNTTVSDARRRRSRLESAALRQLKVEYPARFFEIKEALTALDELDRQASHG